MNWFTKGVSKGFHAFDDFSDNAALFVGRKTDDFLSQTRNVVKKNVVETGPRVSDATRNKIVSGVAGATKGAIYGSTALGGLGLGAGIVNGAIDEDKSALGGAVTGTLSGFGIGAVGGAGVGAGAVAMAIAKGIR